MKIFEVMDRNESFKKIPEQYKPKKHSFHNGRRLTFNLYVSEHWRVRDNDNDKPIPWYSHVIAVTSKTRFRCIIKFNSSLQRFEFLERLRDAAINFHKRGLDLLNMSRSFDLMELRLNIFEQVSRSDELLDDLKVTELTDEEAYFAVSILTRSHPYSNAEIFQIARRHVQRWQHVKGAVPLKSLYSGRHKLSKYEEFAFWNPELSQWEDSTTLFAHLDAIRYPIEKIEEALQLCKSSDYKHIVNLVSRPNLIQRTFDPEAKLKDINPWEVSRDEVENTFFLELPLEYPRVRDFLLDKPVRAFTNEEWRVKEKIGYEWRSDSSEVGEVYRKLHESSLRTNYQNYETLKELFGEAFVSTDALIMRVLTLSPHLTGAFSAELRRVGELSFDDFQNLFKLGLNPAGTTNHRWWMITPDYLIMRLNELTGDPSTSYRRLVEYLHSDVNDASIMDWENYFSRWSEVSELSVSIAMKLIRPSES